MTNTHRRGQIVPAPAPALYFVRYGATRYLDASGREVTAPVALTWDEAQAAQAPLVTDEMHAAERLASITESGDW